MPKIRTSIKDIIQIATMVLLIFGAMYGLGVVISNLGNKEILAQRYEYISNLLEKEPGIADTVFAAMQDGKINRDEAYDIEDKYQEIVNTKYRSAAKIALYKKVMEIRNNS